MRGDIDVLDFDPVGLARLQFAVTALYHFLFVPLTLGLSFLLAVMESVYVMTGREIWRDATKFWGKLFGINFAMGVATGITMEFQFGTNWAYYSHYVGDIFGAPLALEGLMAFFLESTFVGLFFFGWERLSRVGHLVVTALVALGSSLSALWILIANAWMQHPVGAQFNYQTMRMELLSFGEVLFNPVALGRIATRSVDEPVLGIVDLVARARARIVSGIEAHAALKSLRANPSDTAAQARFAAHQADLGYGLMLLRYVSDPSTATSQQIEAAAWSTVPNVPVLFWSFRVMVGLGFYLIALFAIAFYLSARHRFEQNRWFLRLAFWSLPLPWIAAELGDRKSTRLNSSHQIISYAVFCLKKKKHKRINQEGALPLCCLWQHHDVNSAYKQFSDRVDAQSSAHIQQSQREQSKP